MPEKQVSEEVASLFSMISHVNVTKVPEQEPLKRLSLCFTYCCFVTELPEKKVSEEA